MATLAGGCLVFREAAFTCLRGVHDVRSGMGGSTPIRLGAEVRSYSDMLEAVRITFDENPIAFSTLLEVFLPCTIRPR